MNAYLRWIVFFFFFATAELICSQFLESFWDCKNNFWCFIRFAKSLSKEHLWNKTSKREMLWHSLLFWALSSTYSSSCNGTVSEIKHCFLSASALNDLYRPPAVIKAINIPFLGVITISRIPYSFERFCAIFVSSAKTASRVDRPSSHRWSVCLSIHLPQASFAQLLNPYDANLENGSEGSKIIVFVLFRPVMPYHIK